MGYTHYWGDTVISEDTWEQILPAIQKLLALPEASEVIQFEWDNSAPPVADGELIQFNGIGNDGSETFYFHRTGRDGCHWFCKTARKPYDKVATAALCIIGHYLVKNGVEHGIESDGYFSEWEGRELVSKVLDEPLAFSL